MKAIKWNLFVVFCLCILNANITSCNITSLLLHKAILWVLVLWCVEYCHLAVGSGHCLTHTDSCRKAYTWPFGAMRLCSTAVMSWVGAQRSSGPHWIQTASVLSSAKSLLLLARCQPSTHLFFPPVFKPALISSLGSPHPPSSCQPAHRNLSMTPSHTHS